MTPPRPAEPTSDPPRISILDVEPWAAAGGEPVQGIVDGWVEISATLVHDAGERVIGMIRYRRAGTRRWLLEPLNRVPGEPDGDRVTGSFSPDEPGLWEVQIDAWTDRWAAWRADISNKVQGAGQADYTDELAAGRALLEPYTHFPFVAETLELLDEAQAEGQAQAIQLVTLLSVDGLPDRHGLVSLPEPLLVAAAAAELEEAGPEAS